MATQRSAALFYVQTICIGYVYIYISNISVYMLQQWPHKTINFTSDYLRSDYYLRSFTATENMISDCLISSWSYLRSNPGLVCDNSP